MTDPHTQAVVLRGPMAIGELADSIDDYRETLKPAARKGFNLWFPDKGDENYPEGISDFLRKLIDRTAGANIGLEEGIDTGAAQLAAEFGEEAVELDEQTEVAVDLKLNGPQVAVARMALQHTVENNDVEARRKAAAQTLEDIKKELEQ